MKRGRPSTQRRIFAEELCDKNKHIKNDRELARILYNSKFKSEFSDYEAARGMIRQIRGHNGDRLRKNTKNKKLMTPPSHNKTYLDTKDSEQYKSASKRKLVKSKYYIITWAQNNTAIHQDFLDNIEAYSKFHNAEIHVILGRYKNPTTRRESEVEESWDERVVPYSDANRHNIHKNLTLLSDIKIQPTAITPLTGMESMSGLNSAIFGHPKMHLDTIPALEGYESKLVMTTGAITKKNYSDSKAGKKGEFHHVFGFVFVEIKNKDIFIVRQVTALDNGSFSDLCYNVKKGRVRKINKIAYANLGDKHIGIHDPIVESSQRQWLDYFKPKHTIIHDIFNGTSVNHHEEKDPIKKYALKQSGDNLIQKEVEQMFSWVESMKKYNLVVVASNHNDWLDRYIKRKDWMFDIDNAMSYMKYCQILLSGQAPDGLIAYLIKEKFGKSVRTLSRNDSFRIKGIELASHGDIGSNGARGGVAQFKRLSTKIDVGHGHTLKRIDGVMYLGTSTFARMEYMIGASSHRNGDIICHEDGKRQHIIYMGKNKDFTTFAL